MKYLIKLTYATGQREQFGVLVNAYAFAHGACATQKLLRQLKIRTAKHNCAHYKSEYAV